MRSLEHDFDVQVVHAAVHPKLPNSLVLGMIDGSVRQYEMDTKTGELKLGWSRTLKRAVRSVNFSGDGDSLAVISKNRALCLYDYENGTRIRCIRECHQDKPSALCLMADAMGHHWATGDETGCVKMWDLRSPKPMIAEYRKQFDIINSLEISGSRTLLAASSDGTLGAYCTRRGKSVMVSETMHSDLLSIAVSERFCYVGAGDGYIEVFKVGEWGNLLERIRTRHSFGVDCLIMARPGLLLAGSGLEPSISTVHVEPNRRMGRIGEHGMGIGQLAITCDRQWLISIEVDNSIKFWDLPQLLDRVPMIRADDTMEEKAAAKKQSTANNALYDSFFDDLVGGDKGVREEAES